MKITKFKKKINASEEDKQAIKYLRQRILTNDIQYNLNVINEDEYESELKDIAQKVIELGDKYGLDR